MRLKKWRGDKQLLVFVNGWTPSTRRAPVSHLALAKAVDGDGIRISQDEPRGSHRLLTAAEIKELWETIEDEIGVKSTDTFEILLKNVDW